MKRALITGLTGMDGSHLADLLLAKGYEVHGIARRCSRPVDARIAHIADQLWIHEGDLLDQTSLDHVVSLVQPDEVYNLGAQSFVAASWAQPVLTSEVTGLGALRVLEAVRQHAPEARIYQASSSEMFGNADAPQDEDTPFHPRSPYGVAKLFAHTTAIAYRESYDLHVSCGILFNHESERRGLEFVTRKITRSVAEIHAGRRTTLVLGSLDAKRDWGYAPDYVEGMWRMLQQDEPDDYVLATGRTHTVEDFLARALRAAGVPREGHVTQDESLMRPAEIFELRGDASKARDRLGWKPRTSFEELVACMVRSDMSEMALASV